MSKETDEYLKKLVTERLNTFPPDIVFSIGDFGEFTRDQLIQEVKSGTEVGKAAIEMQVNFIKRMPRIISGPC